MEESISLLAQIKKEFALKEVDIRTYSPLTLAYIGDSIYDLIVRTVLVEHANQSTHKLHQEASKYVKAGTQANYIDLIQDMLTEEEADVYKRGRNAKSHTAAKNASLADYRKATGFEALLGWLYLKDNTGRIFELIKAAMERAEMSL